MRELIEVRDATVTSAAGRTLFEGLSLSVSREHVALVGRNGVGKSTLLGILAGEARAEKGRVTVTRRAHFVPQTPISREGALSRGELRRELLRDAMRSGADVLLLDEPSEDLDDAGVAWLRDWLRRWRGCLVVATHDRRLLQDFGHFFIAAESGCRYFAGTMAELDAEMDRQHLATEERYAGGLHRLTEREEHTAYIARRKARKKQYGRCRELDRATPRILLNQKRGDAQVNHGRAAKVREARIAAVRDWTKAMRRALDVTLPLALALPTLPPGDGEDVLVLRDVSAVAEGRTLFASLSLHVRRERLAIVGPNGAGKTTLLEIMSGRRAPTSGSVARDFSKLGTVAQGGADWMLEESLEAQLNLPTPESRASLLVAHKFPLALAQRPMRSLSPGERARAALICLFRRAPAAEVLLLDEPTFSLDLVGRRALTAALRAWPGGLVVASHDRAFLAEVGFDRVIEL